MEINEKQETLISEARTWIVRRIRSIREARGYTQTQVANKMGVCFSRVSDLELGANDYKVSTMLRAAYALGISPEALLKGCPDFSKGKSKKQDPVIVIQQSKLLEKLKAAGVSDSRASSVVQSLVIESA